MIQTEAVGIEEVLKLFGPKIVYPALSRSINRGATRLRSEGRMAIRKHYVVKASAVTKALRIRRAKRSQLEAIVLGEGESIPLAAYNVSQTKRGVSVRVKKSSGKRVIPGTFLETVPGTSHRGVFRRGSQGDGRKRRKSVPRREPRDNVWGTTQLPIDELLGPSVGQMLTGLNVIDDLLSDLDAYMPTVFEHELLRRIDREIDRRSKTGRLSGMAGAGPLGSLG